MVATGVLKIEIATTTLPLSGGPLVATQADAEAKIAKAKAAIKMLVDLGFAPQDALWVEFAVKDADTQRVDSSATCCGCGHSNANVVSYQPHTCTACGETFCASDE